MNHPSSLPSLFLKSTLLLAACILAFAAPGQISHGGKPLPLDIMSGMRALSTTNELFVDASHQQ